MVRRIFLTAQHCSWWVLLQASALSTVLYTLQKQKEVDS